jgi:alpha-2-macroglobulin
LARTGVKAGGEIGAARFEAEFEASGEHWSEALELAVRPVEAFREETRFAVLRPGERLAVEAVEGMHAGTVERSLTVSGVPALALEGAAGYLARYPYGCLEQTVSGGWGLLLGPELAGAGLEAGARGMARQAVVGAGSMQNRDGSFAYWPGSSGVSVEAGLYALEFWLAAREKGLEVDGARLDAGLQWARRWLLRRQWGRGDDRTMAQAAMVLARAGGLDRGWGQRLRERREDLDGAGRRYAAEALMAMGERPAAVEMLAGLRGGEDGGGWMSGEAGTAHLLRLLVRLVPEDGRIPELAMALMRMQRRGHWGHTYANAAAVRAMVAYGAVYPVRDGVPEAVWEGNVLTPGTRLALAAGDSGGVVNRGRVPVFVSERRGGVPREAGTVEAAFGVSTRLLTVEGLPVASPLRSGEAVLLSIRLTGLAGGESHLAVDQRLPAGLEPFPAAVQRALKRHVGHRPAWGSLEGSHVEIRDDQVVVFPPAVSRGETEFFVLLRAVSPGRYTLPGTWVQGMYAEDLAGRSAAGTVEVVR